MSREITDFRCEVYKIHQDGICDRCEYDLTGNASGVCPECRLAVPKKAGGDIG